MASRIITSGEVVASEPIVWRQLGQPVQRAEENAQRSIDQSPAKPAVDANLLAEIEKQARAEAARAHDEGYRQGEAAGRKLGRAEVDPVIERLARSIEDLAGFKPRLRQQAERDVVWLALEISRRILRREVRIDPEALLGLVKAALEGANLREVSEVRVHPSHAAPVRAYLANIGAPEAIVVRPDPALEPGAAIVESSRGSLDASLDTQLEEIGRGLADAVELSHRHPPGANRR